MTVIEEIAAERQRQKDVEGWTPEHDDMHTDGEMAIAAAEYAKIGAARYRAIYAQELKSRGEPPPVDWPWESKWWKPKDRRKNLIRAAALIVAELERLDRNAPPTK
jgi:hypothetical protein